MKKSFRVNTTGIAEIMVRMLSKTLKLLIDSSELFEILFPKSRTPLIRFSMSLTEDFSIHSLGFCVNALSAVPVAELASLTDASKVLFSDLEYLS